MPAMVANATPCGSTIIAPVIPATRSSLRVVRLTIGHQRRKGSILYSSEEELEEGATVFSVFFSLISGHALVIKILRVFRFREREPALRQQSKVLQYKRSAQQCGSQRGRIGHAHRETHQREGTSR